MKLFDCIQRSPEWLKARIGIPTASSFDQIITTKGEPSKQRQKYLYRLAGERIIGITEENYQNTAMVRGCELEEEARQLYEIVTDNIVTPIGFCLMEEGYGASPDGLIGEDGILEIKCPNLATHVSYLINYELPIEYFQQVQGGLMVTNRQWCDFESHYPGMKPFIFRVMRDEDFIRVLRNQLTLFCSELAMVYQKLIQGEY